MENETNIFHAYIFLLLRLQLLACCHCSLQVWRVSVAWMLRCTRRNVPYQSGVMCIRRRATAAISAVPGMP